MADPFDGRADTVSGPATRSVPVVKHDTNELTDTPKAILVGTAGTIVGQLRNDTADRTFTLQAGYHPLRFKLIKTASTAADIVALY